MRDRVRDERVSSPSTVLDGVGVRCDGEVPCNRNLWVGDTVPAVGPVTIMFNVQVQVPFNENVSKTVFYFYRS